MRCVIATKQDWLGEVTTKLAQRFSAEYHLISDPKNLTREQLDKVSPDYVFFPHWSHIIPPSVYEKYPCVIFHMTDLPFGRGGSPLQNLIARGMHQTKISALKCVKELDAGPVYLKRPLSLQGSAHDIYKTANRIILDMMIEILSKQPTPVEQTGEVVTFKRRQPSESNLQAITNLHSLYDVIRMLDAPRYPKAFLETKAFRFEFSRVSLEGDELIADVRIKQREK